MSSLCPHYFHFLDIYKKILHYVLIFFTFWTYTIFSLINILTFTLYWTYASNLYNLIQLNVYLKYILFIFFSYVQSFYFLWTLHFFFLHMSICCETRRFAARAVTYKVDAKDTRRVIRKQSFLMRGLSPHKIKSSLSGLRKRTSQGAFLLRVS